MKLNSVKAPVWNGCWVKVRDQNYKQVGPKVMDQVRAHVEDQIRPEVFIQIWDRIRAEVEENIHETKHS